MSYEIQKFRPKAKCPHQKNNKNNISTHPKTVSLVADFMAGKKMAFSDSRIWFLFQSSGTMNLGGSMTRQAEHDGQITDQLGHIINIGKQVEAMENRIR